MSSSEDNESDELTLTPPEIQEAARAVIENLLPPKSKEKYLKSYENFVQWKNERKSKSLCENVFLAYFGELAKKVKPPTLWVIYSMLKCTVLMKHNVNLKQYANLTSMLKRQSDGYKCKKSKVFTASNVKMFLFEAPDSVYLNLKVILIFGIFGACRCNEITNITIKDVENHDGVIIVSRRDSKTKIDRTFVIRDESAEIVQKYIALRPTDVKSDRFFLNYKNNKCTKQVIGRHKIATIPKAIATYLKLPNPEQYTGHCFRRSSETVLADIGANLITLKRHGEWKSDWGAESYVEESFENESSITEVKTRKQVNYDQMTGLIEFLQEHPHLARGSTRGRRGRLLSLKLWKLCAKKLNSIEDGNPKDGKAWSRYWCDWKYRVRRRALELRAAKENNIPTENLVPLSDIEETLLKLIGENAVDGVVIKSDPLADESENTEVPNDDDQDDDDGQDYHDSTLLNQSLENRPRRRKGRKRRHSSIEATDSDENDEPTNSREQVLNPPRPAATENEGRDADDTDHDDEAAEFLRLERENLENSRRLQVSLQTIATEITRLADVMTHIRDFLINNRININNT